MLNTIKTYLKRMHILPVYRVDVLWRAKEYQLDGLCNSINRALKYYNVMMCQQKAIPKFTLVNAHSFNAKNMPYWWTCGNWDTGRMDFLNWLIEQYKDDKTDLRKL